MPPVRDRSLNIVLWLGQLVLASVFAMTGLAKLTSPIFALASQMPWVTDVPAPLVHFIGACEIAGAIGLVLPALTGVQPGLTPLAAVGLTVLMVLASLFHFGRGEFGYLVMTVPLGLAALFITWGRLTNAALDERLRA
jgi:hypothetical protein